MKIRTLVVVTLLSFLASAMSAQESKKTMRATGRVVAITPDSITIKPGNTNLTFAVDTSTKVVGKGVGTKTQALKTANKPAQITDLVDENDSVIVAYHDVGEGKLQASRVDIRAKGIKKQ